MHQIIKNVLGVALAAVVLALGYAAVNYVSFYGKSIQPSSFRSFSVTGEGKATATPDVAEFGFQVVSQGGTDLAGTQTTNTNKVNKAIAFVKSKGVEDKDIKTLYYNIEPRYQTYDCRPTPVPLMYGTGSSANGQAIAQPAPVVRPCPPPDIVGYTITQSVDVKVRDFSKIGDIMSGVVSAGANQVGALSFTLDDPAKVQDEARARAIAKAKTKAEGVAEAGGFKIGRLLNITEGYMPYPVYSYAAAAGFGGGGSEALKAAPSPAIQPGSQGVTVNVTLQYEIE